MNAQRAERKAVRDLALAAADRGDYRTSSRLFGGNGDGTEQEMRIDIPENEVDELKRQYVTEEISQADISERYGANKAKVSLYCKQRGWTQARTKHHKARMLKLTDGAARLIRAGLTEKRILEQGYTPGNIKAARRLYKLKGTRGRKGDGGFGSTGK